MTESGISAQKKEYVASVYDGKWYIGTEKEYVAAVYDGKWYIGTEKLSLLMTVSRSNN